MDKDLLREKGFTPKRVGLTYLKGYHLRIGTRITLLADKASYSHDTFMETGNSKIQTLYRSGDVKEYVSQVLNANSLADEAIEAVVYILLMEKLSGGIIDYTDMLSGVAKRLGLPKSYFDKVKIWI